MKDLEENREINSRPSHRSIAARQDYAPWEINRTCKHCAGQIKIKPCGKGYCPRCVSSRYFAEKAKPQSCQCGLGKTQFRLSTGRLVWRCGPCWTASYSARAHKIGGRTIAPPDEQEIAKRVAEIREARAR